MASNEAVPESVSAETQHDTETATSTITTTTTPAPEKETATTATTQSSAPVTDGPAQPSVPTGSDATPEKSAVEDATPTATEAVESTANTTTGTATDVTPTPDTQISERSPNDAPESIALVEGESSDQTQAAKETEEESGPELMITLLLTTGARHPFKIDNKYLRKRSVQVENDDPFTMSVYTLKELIWREWRAEWEPRPSSPSSIRLISFGKLLDDKSPLTESKFNHDAPNVVHMTVKPQEVIDEEDAKGGKSYSGRERDTSERSPGCRCVIL